MNLILDCTHGTRKASFAEGLLELLEEDALLSAVDRINDYLAKIGKALVPTRNENRLSTQLRSISANADGGNAASAHEHEQGHERDHAHEHEHHSVDEVFTIIESMHLPSKIEMDIFGVYDFLAKAEAKAHNVDLVDVHFHEVGNLDAISYITVSAIAMNEISPEIVSATPICTGFGFVDCAHGRLPIPAPATANILEGRPTFPGNEEGELTTPTGAALACYYAFGFIDDTAFARVKEDADGDILVAKVG